MLTGHTACGYRASPLQPTRGLRTDHVLRTDHLPWSGLGLGLALGVGCRLRLQGPLIGPFRLVLPPPPAKCCLWSVLVDGGWRPTWSFWGGRCPTWPFRRGRCLGLRKKIPRLRGRPPRAYPGARGGYGARLGAPCPPPPAGPATQGRSLPRGADARLPPMPTAPMPTAPKPTPRRSPRP